MTLHVDVKMDFSAGCPLPWNIFSIYSIFWQTSDAFMGHEETWHQVRKMFQYESLGLGAEPKALD